MAMSLNLIIFLSAVEAGMICECQSIKLQRELRSKLERDFVKKSKQEHRKVKADQWVLFFSNRTSKTCVNQKFQPVVEAGAARPIVGGVECMWAGCKVCYQGEVKFFSKVS